MLYIVKRFLNLKSSVFYHVMWVSSSSSSLSKVTKMFAPCMKSLYLHTSLNIAHSGCNPNNFMSSNCTDQNSTLTCRRPKYFAKPHSCFLFWIYNVWVYFGFKESKIITCQNVQKCAKMCKTTAASCSDTHMPACVTATCRCRGLTYKQIYSISTKLLFR